MTNENEYATIRILATTRDRLNNLRRGSETQDDFIRKLMDEIYPSEE